MTRPFIAFLRAGICAALLTAPLPALADGAAGAYLAGREALMDNDIDAVARYFSRVMTQDPTNLPAMESALTAFVDKGDIDSALAVARRLDGPGPGDPIAGLLLLAELAHAADWDTLIARVDQDGAGGPLTDGLTAAWAEVARGNMAAALDRFDKVIASDTLGGFGKFHKALALVMVGDLEGAEAILAGDDGKGLAGDKHTVIVWAEVLAGLDRRDQAIKVLDAYSLRDDAPDVLALLAALRAGDAAPVPLVTDPVQGVAEVYYGIARALRGDTDDPYVLMHSRLAEYLDPGNADATLLSAAVLEDMDQFDLATAAYDRIARDDPAYFSAELGRAEAMRKAGRNEAAVEVLTQLAKSFPEMPSVHANLGDLLRGLQRYDAAATAYSKALKLYHGGEPGLWYVYYTRGICNEREGRWDQAEADFREALKLNPGQPQVLNYIGYSFVEMNTNLDEALAMIRKAVELRPRDGYITDSLGWAYYRLGRYQEAVPWMETAAQLTPVDPVINDHLGDVYWAVGRHREARFQWNRALSFDPEEADADRIRRKLEVGLDAVLAAEGAPPIAVAHDG